MNKLFKEYEKREYVENALQELKNMGFLSKNAILSVNKRGYYYVENKYVIDKKISDYLMGEDLYI